MVIALSSVQFITAQMVGTPYIAPGVAPLLTSVISSSQTICSGNPPETLASVVGGGSGSYTYAWQSSTNNNSWTNVSGATAATYTPGTLTANTYYRQEVSSGNQTVYSNSVLITVQTKLAMPTITLDRTCIYVGGDTILTASVPSIAGATYSWTLSNSNGLQFTQTPAATDNIVSIRGIADGSYTVSVSITNACGFVTTNPESVTVRIFPNSLDNAKLFAQRYLTQYSHGWWIAWKGVNGVIRYEVYGSASPMPNMDGVGCFANPNAGNQLCPSPEYDGVQVTTGWATGVSFYMQRVIDGACTQAQVTMTPAAPPYRYFITGTTSCGATYESYVDSGTW